MFFIAYFCRYVDVFREEYTGWVKEEKKCLTAKNETWLAMPDIAIIFYLGSQAKFHLMRQYKF